MMMMMMLMMIMMIIVTTIVLRLMMKTMKGFFGACLGVPGVLWGAFWSCLRPFRSPPGAFQDEAKSRAHSTSRFSEDVSSEIAMFELRRLKTSSPNCCFFEDVSSETAIFEYSSYSANPICLRTSRAKPSLWNDLRRKSADIPSARATVKRHGTKERRCFERNGHC